METRSNDLLDTSASATTPDDVVALFSWANIPGAPYRDFSASRREQRAQLRLRNAEHAREVELTAEMEAKAAAGHAETLAERAVAFSQSTPSAEARERASLVAEEADRLAAAERVEAARRSEAAAQASLLAEQSQREIADAAISARRQEVVYEQAAARSSAPLLPGEISDPYVPAPVIPPATPDGDADRRSPSDRRSPGSASAATEADNATGSLRTSAPPAAPLAELNWNNRRSESPSVPAYPSRLDTPSRRRDDSQVAGSEAARPETVSPLAPIPEYLEASFQNRRIRPSSWAPSLEELSSGRNAARNPAREISRAIPVPVPSPAPAQAPTPRPTSITPSRRQEPSRWFTLNDLLLQPSRIDADLALAGSDLQLPPVLAVFSPAWVDASPRSVSAFFSPT